MAHIRQEIHLGAVGAFGTFLGLAQGNFGLLAAGDILHRADGAQRRAVLGVAGLAAHFDIFEPAIRHQKAVRQIVGRAAGNRLGTGLLDERAVLRMYALLEEFECGVGDGVLDLENRKQLVGPDARFVAMIDFVGSKARHILCFPQARFAGAQCLLGQHHMIDVFDHANQAMRHTVRRARQRHGNPDPDDFT